MQPTRNTPAQLGAGSTPSPENARVRRINYVLTLEGISFYRYADEIIVDASERFVRVEEATLMDWLAGKL